MFTNGFGLTIVPLNVSGEFPDAPDTFDYDAGVQWLQNKFIEQSNGANKLVYAHVTTATDKSNIGVVIDAVRDYRAERGVGESQIHLSI